MKMENRLSIKYLLLVSMALIFFSCKQETSSSQSKMPEVNESVEVEYIAHASFILKYNEHSILLDPFADTTWISYSFPRNISVDAIFSTHPHYDHDGGIFRDLKPYWQGQFPFYQDPGKYEVGDFKVTGLKGKHCDPYGKEFGQKNTIFIYEAAGIRIAHWGDNGPITDSLAAGLTDIDVLMLPIDDSYHILKAGEIDTIIATINPKIVIPMHYKIEELEPTPGKPKNLESIDNYFEGMENVVRLGKNIHVFDKMMIPSKLTYFIFDHSERVKK
jgi:L-ascorbate metabolism protein UlaG (beta-lactamase superfamily)